MKPSLGTMASWLAEFSRVPFRQRALVTGGSGFIGSHLCRALALLGAEVYACSRGTVRAPLPTGCRPVSLDLADLPAVQETLKGVRPSLIFHLAGFVTGRPDLELIVPMLRANLIGTVNLLIAAQSCRCQRIVVACSSEEPVSITTGPPPSSPYAASKAAVTLYARMFQAAYGLPVVCVRLFHTFGPGQDRSKLVPYAVSEVLAGRAPRILSGQRVCDFIYVLDVVRGLLKAGVQAGVEGEIFDLGCGRGTTIREVVQLIAELCGGNVTPVFEAASDRREQPSQVADTRAAGERLGWQPGWPLTDGLAETIEWYRSCLGAPSG